MTKARSPDSFADAALTAIHALGRARTAQIVGRAEHRVYQWAAPDPDADRPNVELALRLDIAMVKAGHVAPFLAAWQAQLARVDAPAAAPADPRARMLAVMREIGEAAAAVHDASADGHISAGERAEIAKQAREARDALDALMRDVAPPVRAVRGGEGA